MAYITTTLLSAIDKDAVASLKTAQNIMDMMVQSGTSAIHIPPIPPDTDETIIELPIFVTSATIQYPYEKIDAIKVSGDKELSAYPGPCTMTISAEDGTPKTINGIATNECTIIATSNSIINKLLNDNMLMYSMVQNKTLKWYSQTEDISYTFDADRNYPYYYNYVSASPLNPLIEVVFRNKITDYDSSPIYDLEGIKSFNVDPKVPVPNLISCNIMAHNLTLNKYINIKDWYIDEFEHLYIKLRTDYFNSGTQIIDFKVYVHYFYI